MFDRRMTAMDQRFARVKSFCQNGMIIPVPPLQRNANEIERTFHKMKRDALVHKPSR